LLKRFNGAGKPMRKQPLIILGVILVLVILALAFYAYQKTQITTPISQTPPAPTTPTQETKTTDEEKAEKELELEKIKRSVGGINNETFQVSEADCEEENEEDQKRVEEFTQEVIEGTFKVSEGKVLEISSSKLKIEFQQGDYKWISEVTTNSNTNFETINSSGQTSPSSFSNIKVGDRIIAQSSDNRVVDSDFTAELIYTFIN
jgi:anti-sigma28 factor (negative regulator of flagellin synthesis)